MLSNRPRHARALAIVVGAAALTVAAATPAQTTYREPAPEIVRMVDAPPPPPFPAPG